MNEWGGFQTFDVHGKRCQCCKQEERRSQRFNYRASWIFSNFFFSAPISRHISIVSKCDSINEAWLTKSNKKHNFKRPCRAFFSLFVLLPSAWWENWYVTAIQTGYLPSTTVLSRNCFSSIKLQAECVSMFLLLSCQPRSIERISMPLARDSETIAISEMKFLSQKAYLWAAISIVCISSWFSEYCASRSAEKREKEGWKERAKVSDWSLLFGEVQATLTLISDRRK